MDEFGVWVWLFLLMFNDGSTHFIPQVVDDKKGCIASKFKFVEIINYTCFYTIATIHKFIMLINNIWFNTTESNHKFCGANMVSVAIKDQEKPYNCALCKLT